MRLSTILLVILCVLVAAVAVAAFVVPQPILDAFEWWFAAAVVPVLGGLWLGNYIVASRGH